MVFNDIPIDCIDAICLLLGEGYGGGFIRVVCSLVGLRGGISSGHVRHFHDRRGPFCIGDFVAVLNLNYLGTGIIGDWGCLGP